MGRGGLLTKVLGCGLLCIGTAHAFPQEHLKTARTALLEKDRKATRAALEQAYESFAAAEGVIPNDVLASYWYYRGLVALERKKHTRTMDAFRQALTVDNAFSWDRELSENTDARRLFEALRSEVRGRDVASPKVPKKTGEAQMYVDGTRVRHGDWVAVGDRLAQVQCPEGDVYGSWVNFNDSDVALDWISLCPYAVDTSIVVTALPVEDEFDIDDIPEDEDSGGIVGGIVTDADGDPIVSELKSEEPSAEPTGDDKAASGTDGTTGSLWTSRNIVMLSGAGMVTTGVVLHYAVVKPSHAMVEWGRRNPTEVSRYQADILTERFVQRRAVTMAVLGSGVVVAGAGFFLMKPTSVQPWVSINGAGLHGRW